MERFPESCEELVGLIKDDVKRALEAGDDRTFKWFVKYALSEILPDWEIMEHIIAESENGEFAADFLCVSEESAKLVEVVTTPDRYDEQRYKTLLSLCETIASESASCLFHSAATLCAKSRLKQRKQALGATCGQLESSRFDLSRVQRCEIVFITPEAPPWFDLSGATQITFGKLTDACDNRALAELIMNAVS